MTELTITSPLRLYKGTQPRGSGRGCIMNVISWMHGDVRITDHPMGYHPYARKLLTLANDTYCTHSLDSSEVCAECAMVLIDCAEAFYGSEGDNNFEQRFLMECGHLETGPSYLPHQRHWDLMKRMARNYKATRETKVPEDFGQKISNAYEEMVNTKPPTPIAPLYPALNAYEEAFNSAMGLMLKDLDTVFSHTWNTTGIHTFTKYTSAMPLSVS